MLALLYISKYLVKSSLVMGNTNDTTHCRDKSAIERANQRESALNNQMTNDVRMRPSPSSNEGLKTDSTIKDGLDITDVAFSFSSISTKSSNSEVLHDSNAPVDMRNDEPQPLNSMNDELRAAQSSYDEAATEAVNYHYSGASYLQGTASTPYLSSASRMRDTEELRSSNTQRRDS